MDVTTTPAPPRRSSVGRILAVLFGLLVAAVGLFALLWAFGRSSGSQQESFSDPVDRMVIDVSGRVELTAGDETSVDVESEWLLTGRPDVEISLTEGTLQVTSRCGWINFGCQTHVTATVPATAAIEVETAAGSVTATGFEAGVDIATSAGSVSVEEIVGVATLRSSAGRIEGTITDGDVDAQTSAGSIDLDLRGDVTRVSAVTSAGNVVLRLPDGTYRVDAETSAGSTEIDVPTDPSAEREIYARSSAGSIRIERGPS